MVFEDRRHALRLLERRQLDVALLLGLLNAPLDVANRLGVFVDLDLVLRSERSPQVRQLLRHRVEDALVLAQSRLARRRDRVLPLSPNSRSNTARGLYSIGSGCVGLRHEIVCVYAQLRMPVHAPALAGASIAISSDASCVSLPNWRASNLVHRDVRDDLDLVAPTARRARQKRSGRARVNVVPARLDAREHEHLIPEWRQRLENRRQLEALPSPFGDQYSIAIPFGT